MKPTLHSVSLKKYRKLSMYSCYNNTYMNTDIRYIAAPANYKTLDKVTWHSRFIIPIKYLGNNNPPYHHGLCNFRFTRVHLNLSNFR